MVESEKIVNWGVTRHPPRAGMPLGDGYGDLPMLRGRRPLAILLRSTK